MSKMFVINIRWYLLIHIVNVVPHGGIVGTQLGASIVLSTSFDNCFLCTMQLHFFPEIQPLLKYSFPETQTVSTI